MKLHGDITINGTKYAKGSDAPGYFIYPFFLFHMLIFGASGFVMAYAPAKPDPWFLYTHGGFAIIVYLWLYRTIFGVDEVKWMLINGALGVLGIYSQVGWLLSVFGKNIKDVPLYIHVIPFLYFVLYTFLIRHAFLDLLKAREDKGRVKFANATYVLVSIAVNLAFFFL